MKKDVYLETGIEEGKAEATEGVSPYWLVDTILYNPSMGGDAICYVEQRDEVVRFDGEVWVRYVRAEDENDDAPPDTA